VTHFFGQGYKHKEEDKVHLYTECPDGSQLPIAQRDPVNFTATPLEFCTWCWGKFQRENPRKRYQSQ